MSFKRLILFFLAVLVGLAMIAVVAIASGLISLPFLHHASTVSTGNHPLEVAYLTPVGEGAALWSAPLEGGSPRMLSRNTETVLDFAVAPNGNLLAFSAENNQGGSDLWTVDRSGGEQKTLLHCGVDHCQNLSFSPDGAHLAFSRIITQPQAGEKPDFPHGYLLDIETRQAHPLQNDPLLGSQFITWSPDGKKLSYFDPSVPGIRVHEIASGREVVLPTPVPSPGSWSPDSQSLIFQQEDETNGFAYIKVYLMDFASGKGRQILGSGEDDASDYSLPVWSPDGKWLVFAQRTVEGVPAKQLRIMHLDGSGLRFITDDPSWTQAAYHWSPDGKYLVFQRYALGSSENVPEVMAWEMVTGQLKQLAAHGAAPQWLP